MATKTDTKTVENLVINKVASPAVYQSMVESGQINDDEIYLVQGDTGPTPSTQTPAMDGTGAAGSSTEYARADHVHPTDTSRAAATHTHTASDITSGLATVATSGDYTDLSNTPTLATVATSGSYADLSNKPTIPAAGIPSGGTSGQVLTKSSGTDYDAAWANASGGGGMVVNITYSNNAYQADKTYSEIYAAASAGQFVVAKRDNNIYTLSKWSQYSVEFTLWSFGSYNDISNTYITIYTNNNVSIGGTSKSLAKYNDNYQEPWHTVFVTSVEESGEVQYSVNDEIFHNLASTGYYGDSGKYRDVDIVLMYQKNYGDQFPDDVYVNPGETPSDQDILDYTANFELYTLSNKYTILTVDPNYDQRYVQVYHYEFTKIDGGMLKKFHITYDSTEVTTTVTYSEEELGGDGDIMVVHVALNNLNVPYSDKTYAEITSAVSAGKAVFAIYNRAVYKLVDSGGSHNFYHIAPADMHYTRTGEPYSYLPVSKITIYSDNTIGYYASAFDSDHGDRNEIIPIIDANTGSPFEYSYECTTSSSLAVEPIYWMSDEPPFYEHSKLRIGRLKQWNEGELYDGDTAACEFYNLVKYEASAESNEGTDWEVLVHHVGVFKTMSSRNGNPVEKTITITVNEYTTQYLIDWENAVVTYSETAFAVAT